MEVVLDLFHLGEAEFLQSLFPLDFGKKCGAALIKLAVFARAGRCGG